VVAEVLALQALEFGGSDGRSPPYSSIGSPAAHRRCRIRGQGGGQLVPPFEGVGEGGGRLPLPFESLGESRIACPHLIGVIS
jgi:hypothetical protein